MELRTPQMERMIIKRTATNECFITLLLWWRKGPISPIGKRTMGIKPPHYFSAPCFVFVRIEMDNLKTIMHTRDEEIVLPTRRGMPFDSPCTSTNINLRQGCQRFSHIKQADSIVVS